MSNMAGHVFHGLFGGSSHKPLNEELLSAFIVEQYESERTDLKWWETTGWGTDSYQESEPPVVLNEFEERLKSASGYTPFTERAWDNRDSLNYKEVMKYLDTWSKEELMARAISTWDNNNPLVALAWADLSAPDAMMVTQDGVMLQYDDGPRKMGRCPISEALEQHILKRLA